MLHEKFKNHRIILASASPRRQELFKTLNLPFKVMVKEVNEVYSSALKKEEITNYLATLKSEEFKNNLSPNTLVITADTIVWHKNKPLEKPSSKQMAITMLEELSNNTHQVFTSVCIASSTKSVLVFDESFVTFKDLTKKEIEYYVENYSPFDKAGGYGIQDWIGYIGVTKIEGSYYNVMGLPVHKIYEELLKF